MRTHIPTTDLKELFRNKYHTSEVIRSQIAEIKEKASSNVIKEPLKSFVVKFYGKVIDCSFEKTLKIVTKRLFLKGKLDNFRTIREDSLVEANITATLTEVESLISYLMKPHIILRRKKGETSGESNLLIIDESEQNLAENIMPEYVHRNCVTNAESCEKYTGRLSDYLILNGLPLTSERIGRELRFNKIETKNKVFTVTGLKEIVLNLHFISLILKLDLEQHYLKLRIFNLLEDDLKMAEEKIDELGYFSDIFNQIASKDNPILYNRELFLDLIRIEHIIENNNWGAMPAYAGYVYSAADKLNTNFKLLEEYNLFLTYAGCIEKFVEKLNKKLFKHTQDVSIEQNNLTANYNELKKLQFIPNHSLLQEDYKELLNSFGKLLTYLNFLAIDDKKGGVAVGIHIEEKPPNKLFMIIKKIVEAVFSIEIDITTKPTSHHEHFIKTGHEEDIQKLIVKFSENLEKLTRLKTVTDGDAFLEARKFIPNLTNLSDILDQLKNLIKDVEGKKEINEPFKAIFARSDKFEILYKKMDELGIFENEKEKEFVRGKLMDLQKLLFNKPLMEDAYNKITNAIQSLEGFVLNKNKSIDRIGAGISVIISNLYQNQIFKTIIGIKMGIQAIIEKESQYRKIESFKYESEFYSYSARELDDFFTQIVKFHERLKDTSYYKNVSKYETIEKEFDSMLDEVVAVDNFISSHTRDKDRRVSKEPDVHIDYLKSSQLTRRNLEKAILLLQGQITQMDGFIRDIESNLLRHSLIYSGVATSVRFDQITYLLSNIDVRLLSMTKSMEDMFNESVSTIFHYQVGETFVEPQREDFNNLMKEIEKKTIVRRYHVYEKANAQLQLS